MKKFAIALAVLPAAAAVHAQSSVQLYGLVDAGIEYVNHAGPTGDSVTRLTSGGMNTSRWGIRGSEDLGSGLKAIFQLESGIQIDTGSVDGSAGSLFRRQANVGLEGGFGRLIAGRSYTTAYDFVLPFDPMGYAPVYSWATASNATSAIANTTAFGMTTASDNLLKYSKRFGNGVSVGASYGFGEVAGSTSTGRKYAVAAGYTSGPIGVAATYERNHFGTSDAPANRDTVAHLGASWQINNAIALKGAYRYYKRDTAAGGELRGDTAWAGVNWQVTPAVGLTAAVYRLNVKDAPAGVEDADPTLIVLRAKYSLSKRTDLYATVGHARSKNDQLVGLSRDLSPQGSSDTQTGTMIGVQHRF
ncbi:porin [Azohydromonas aeria]|uniref:porin n=1 Tax=Azohydromonas aeria TaxID=2590212 RepID=UPI0012FB8CF5|nr:porin [Azohydromonas aeria]